MRNFKYNHKRNRFRSNGDRNIKNIHSDKDNFHFIDGSDHKRRNFSKQNHNCLKLIDKYNDLAREALSKGDKITSENYFQHADHFLRIENQKSKNNNPLEEKITDIDKKKEIQETDKKSINN